MPRPPADIIVDADVYARAGSRVERHFSADDLPRLAEVGARTGSALDASFQFSLFENRPAVDGELSGTVVLTCQRCMQAVSIPVSERFQIVVVDEERADEPGGYEPVAAEAKQLDLRWLAEDQALLSLPLVPMHEPDECNEAGTALSGTEDDDEVRQQPFANLRDMLRQR